MDPVLWVMRWADPVLIAPYRWFSDPGIGLWFGTFILAVWCTLLGEITMGLAYRFNWRHLKARTNEMVKQHNRSVNALLAGEKELYQGFNKLANDAFGKAFFQNLAMGMGSLWPIFFAAAWLQERFLNIEFPLPYEGLYMPWTGSFAMIYIMVRVLFGRYLKNKLPFFKTSYRLQKLMAPKQRMNLFGMNKVIDDPNEKENNKTETKA